MADSGVRWPTRMPVRSLGGHGEQTGRLRPCVHTGLEQIRLLRLPEQSGQGVLGGVVPRRALSITRSCWKRTAVTGTPA
ncbi:hypothetical protein GCM10010244_68170 [Streptomyces coeruleorubidus]|nr:hypothetical protein GCM10010244_68170 [Streptomyces bellus]